MHHFRKVAYMGVLKTRAAGAALVRWSAHGQHLNARHPRLPERVAMMLTGHKTRSVFERYNVVSEADLGAGVAKLASALRDNVGTIERTPIAVSDRDSRIPVEKLVARDGIEPPTLRFSVACSTN